MQSISRPSPQNRLPWPGLLLLVTIFCSLSLGCVRRRLTVRSNPPGALVYIDDQEIGRTPVSVNFIYYGTRTIKLVKDGYESITENHTISPPWYQVPPLDLISDNFVPREIRDERALDFQMVPKHFVRSEDLILRGENLRRNAQQGYLVPLPGSPATTFPLSGPPLQPLGNPSLPAGLMTPVRPGRSPVVDRPKRY